MGTMGGIWVDLSYKAGPLSDIECVGEKDGWKLELVRRLSRSRGQMCALISEPGLPRFSALVKNCQAYTGKSRLGP